MTPRTNTHPLWSSLAIAVALAFAVLPGLESRADAVKSSAATFAITPVPAGAGEYATYTIGQFTTDNNETLVGVTLVFPAEADVSQASAAVSGDTVTVSGQAVTVRFGSAAGPRQAFSVRIANIRNPLTPGVFSLDPSAEFIRPNGSRLVHSLKKPTFTIMDSPYLVLRIDTGALADVDFGSVQPGADPAPQTVTVAVDSSLPYTMTRTLSGQVSDLGLSVTGPADGSKPAGYAEYDDIYAIAPPWTTEPGDYSVSIQYTVVHP